MCCCATPGSQRAIWWCVAQRMSAADHRYEPEWYLSDDDDGGSEDDDRRWLHLGDRVLCRVAWDERPGAYAASKAGLMGLVQTAAREWGRTISGLISCVRGGRQRDWPVTPILPPMTCRGHVLGRLSNLDEVSETICRLAQLHDVSGQVWNVDSRIL